MDKDLQEKAEYVSDSLKELDLVFVSLEGKPITTIFPWKDGAVYDSAVASFTDGDETYSISICKHRKRSSSSHSQHAGLDDKEVMQITGVGDKDTDPVPSNQPELFPFDNDLDSGPHDPRNTD